MMRLPVVLILLFGAYWLPARALAASELQGVTITFKNGTVMTGLLVEQDPDWITLEIGEGTTTLSREHLLTVEIKDNSIVIFKKKLAAAESPEELWTLVLWAKTQNLDFHARQTAKRVIELENDHPAARRFLKHEKIKGEWFSGDAAQRAKGLVEHNGYWMAPAMKLDLQSEAKNRASRRAASINRRRANRRRHESTVHKQYHQQLRQKKSYRSTAITTHHH